jgi:hypothetical protein
MSDLLNRDPLITDGISPQVRDLLAPTQGMMRDKLREMERQERRLDMLLNGGEGGTVTEPQGLKALIDQVETLISTVDMLCR